MRNLFWQAMVERRRELITDGDVHACADEPVLPTSSFASTSPCGWTGAGAVAALCCLPSLIRQLAGLHRLRDATLHR